MNFQEMKNCTLNQSWVYIINNFNLYNIVCDRSNIEFTLRLIERILKHYLTIPIYLIKVVNTDIMYVHYIYYICIKSSFNK